MRNYLNIHIVGADEIDKSKGANNSSFGDPTEVISVASLSPQLQLESLFKDKTGSNSFEEFKDTLRSFWSKGTYKNPETKNWKSFKDLPAKEARKIRVLVKDL